MRNIQLSGGDTLPALGLGTWKSAPGEVGAAVREALRIGYRHIDCAPIYGNEHEIGPAIADAVAAGEVTRDELWITSKLWNDRHERKHVVPALKDTLSALRLDRLDLFLVHWPVALKKGRSATGNAKDYISLAKLPLTETWQGMEAAQAAGLTRHIGVSNFSAKKLRELCAVARVRPAMNQVELHPYLAQVDLLGTCRELGVAVTAYSPLGSQDRPAGMRAADERNLLVDPLVVEVARGVGATPAQVLIAWALQRGTAVIPKSVNPKRLAENFAAADLTLAPADMQRLESLDVGRRYVTGEFWTTGASPYTLANLWDE
ncbi:MAG: aldo/keto reductase [Planctomycetes bacterium]|nr:aldo/keto reductase [Planctomycetota bacterium]